MDQDPVDPHAARDRNDRDDQYGRHPLDQHHSGAYCAWLSLVLLPLLLAACAGARLTGEQSVPPALPLRPATVAVRVSAPADCPSELPLALGRDVIAQLQKAGIPAWRATPETFPGPDLAILDLTVTHYDPGNRLEQAVIGFGAGRSQLDVEATLALGDSRPLSMSTDADSGRKPGLILPAGAAAATGDLLHLAVGGGLVAITQLRGGSSRDLRSTAGLLAERTVAYFHSVGWDNWGQVRLPAAGGAG